jgi:retron-type reverse transcriptase
VLRFNHQKEDHLHELSQQLRAGTWRPGPHRHFQIREPKLRWISAAPYSDRVVHHALCRVIGPVLDARLIDDCFANRVGKGSHRGVLRYQQLAGQYRYALKLDIRQYFPAIDHQILEYALRRIFKDDRLLDLMTRILYAGVVPAPYCAYFDGDDLFTPGLRPKGLPIGNLTSQLWANAYLSGFDHWVKECLGAQGYLRYVDDFILLNDNPAQLHRWLVDVRQSAEGMPFLGYFIWPNCIRVRGESVRRFRRKIRRREQAGAAQEDRTASLVAWRGHVRWAGSWRQLRGSCGKKERSENSGPSAR